MDYRGMDSDGKWYYGGINEKHTMIVSGFTFIPVDPETIGHNTYCTDVRGREAYEDDVVVPADGEQKIPAHIVYVPDRAQYMAQSYRDGTLAPLASGTFEIVGYTRGGDGSDR